jgi:hypothetical protein
MVSRIPVGISTALTGVLLLWLAALWSEPALAQVDLAGSWRPLSRNEDGSGIVGDAAGLPISESNRWRGDSWSPEDFDVAEWVCRPHPWDFSLEGVLSQLHLWTEVDRATQRIVSYNGHINMEEQETTIWMDGRPHPPQGAPHTWSGFSTGAWDGDVLVRGHPPLSRCRRRGSACGISPDRVVRSLVVDLQDTSAATPEG